MFFRAHNYGPTVGHAAGPTIGHAVNAVNGFLVSHLWLYKTIVERYS